jgi:hypothetical protein
MSSTTPTQIVAVSQDFTVLQALASHYLTNKTVTAPVLLSLTAVLTAELTNVKSLSLADKKKIICDIIESSLQNALALSKAGVGSTVLAEDEVVALNYVVKNVVPHTVDLLVATSTGQFDLKTVKATCWSSFKLCVPAIEAKLRGPVWDVADAFVAAAENKIVTGGSLAEAAGAATAAATVAATAAATAAATVAATAAAAAVTASVSGAAKTDPLVSLVPVVPDWSAPRVDLSGSTVSSSPV